MHVALVLKDCLRFGLTVKFVLSLAEVSLCILDLNWIGSLTTDDRNRFFQPNFVLRPAQ